MARDWVKYILVFPELREERGGVLHGFKHGKRALLKTRRGK